MLNSKIVNSIDKFNENYDGYYHDNVDRQKRLRILVDEFGSDAIALASGLTESTLIQYLRVKTAPTINENSVLKAERWVKFYQGK